MFKTEDRKVIFFLKTRKRWIPIFKSELFNIVLHSLFLLLSVFILCKDFNKNWKIGFLFPLVSLFYVLRLIKRPVHNFHYAIVGEDSLSEIKPFTFTDGGFSIQIEKIGRVNLKWEDIAQVNATRHEYEDGYEIGLYVEIGTRFSITLIEFDSVVVQFCEHLGNNVKGVNSGWYKAIQSGADQVNIYREK